MGGRGASSGISIKGLPYGTEYKSVYQYRNIKYVTPTNAGSTKAPLETMTAGRIYVTVNQDGTLKSITYYTGTGNRHKQIDLTHTHNVNGTLMQPHTHLGYFHKEYGTRALSKKEQRMVAKVIDIWQNRANK